MQFQFVAHGVRVISFIQNAYKSMLKNAIPEDIGNIKIKFE